MVCEVGTGRSGWRWTAVNGPVKLVARLLLRHATQRVRGLFEGATPQWCRRTGSLTSRRAAWLCIYRITADYRRRSKSVSASMHVRWQNTQKSRRVFVKFFVGWGDWSLMCRQSRIFLLVFPKLQPFPILACDRNINYVKCYELFPENSGPFFSVCFLFRK